MIVATLILVRMEALVLTRLTDTHVHVQQDFTERVVGQVSQRQFIKSIGSINYYIKKTFTVTYSW